jgi:hypothetical protein
MEKAVVHGNKIDGRKAETGHSRRSTHPSLVDGLPFHCGRSVPRARHWQLNSNYRTNPSGGQHGRIVPIPEV